MKRSHSNDKLLEKIGQVENSEITETTEITEKAVRQSTAFLPLQSKQINTQNPFDMAWEEKTKKTKIFRDFRVFVFSPIPKNENSEITEILKKVHNTEM